MNQPADEFLLRSPTVYRIFTNLQNPGFKGFK